MSERIADKMIALHIVNEEDREIYVFGIREFFSLLCCFTFTLVIGVVMNLTLEAAVFTCAYLPVRIYAGGYHAATQGRCYILSFAMIISALLIIGHAQIPGYVSMMIIVISSILIYMMSPSEHKNKPLSENERKIYKQRVGKILICLNIISGVVLFMQFRGIVLSIAVALLFLFNMMVISKLKTNYLIKKFKSYVVKDRG